jgi:hypothetical protein
MGLAAVTVDTAAAQVKFKGKFAVTGGGTCVASDTGFDENLTPLGAHYFLTYTLGETRVFRPDGTGSKEVWAVNTDLQVTGPNPGPPLMNEVRCDAEFVYEMQKGGSMTVDITPAHLCTVVKGERQGQTFTFDTLPLAGYGSKQSIALVSVEFVLQTQTFSNNDVFYRLCQEWRNGMAIK